MRKTAIILLIIWIPLCTYFYVCHIKHHCGSCNKSEKKVTEVPAEAISGNTFISDGDWKTSLSENDIYFLPSGDSLIVQGTATNALDSLASYLKSHDRNVTISGFYGNNETFNDPNSNLGIARAEALKGYLVGKGVDSTRIKESFELKDSLAVVDGKVYNPFGFAFTPFFNLDNFNPEVMASVEDYLSKNQNKYIYFQSGSSIMDITPDIHEFLNNVTYYLKFKEDKAVESIGHTDNVGNESANERLGLQRAQDVAKYLTKIGVKESQIKTSSKGSKEPIGDNATEEGRAKNRRVELKLQ